MTPDNAPAGGAAGRRIVHIDALRGLALMGILQVNIQSFTWGSGEPLGYLPGTPAPRVGAALLYFLQATFLEGKFYPIFAFLFGAGLALQTRALHRRHAGDAVAALHAYRRRLAVLALLGVAHGLLLYSGDVLTAYALCGLLFVAVAPRRLKALARFNRWCWVVAAASLLVPLALAGAPVSAALAGRIPADVAYAHFVYCEAGYAGQLGQRALDELWQQVGSVPVFWPELLALFGLGVIAARLGWLQHPRRHPRVWRCALALGLALGLPCALLGAAMSLQRLYVAPGLDGGWDGVVSGLGGALAAAYVAAALRVFTQARAPRAMLWLADAGRLSLSNYVGQSLAMGALLSGWGMGWGADASRAQLAALGLAIFCGQLLLSRWWLRHHAQGPLEALWRRATYGPRREEHAAPG